MLGIEIDYEQINEVTRRFIGDILKIVEEIAMKYGLPCEAQRILIDELFMDIIAHILRFIVTTNAKATLEFYRESRGLKS